MAVLSGATASGRQFYTGTPSTTLATAYTAPSFNANVTSPSSTAYVKEMVFSNTTSSDAVMSVYLGGNIWMKFTVSANDAKYISGTNTMLVSGQTLGFVNVTAGAINVTVSGVEIQ